MGVDGAVSLSRSVIRMRSDSALEGLDGRAGADEVAVAVALVDAADGRPVLRVVDAGRVGGLRGGVGTVPLADERASGVRGAAQGALLGRHGALDDGIDLG